MLSQCSRSYFSCTCFYLIVAVVDGFVNVAVVSVSVVAAVVEDESKVLEVQMRIIKK